MSHSVTSDPPVHCPSLMMMNSAVLIGARPMTMMNLPSSISAWVIVVRSHLTKNASSSFCLCSMPSFHNRMRKTVTVHRMRQIVPQALAFFARYDDPDAVTERIKSDVQYAVQFGADLERFIGLLGLRIGREERTLYPQYDRVHSKKVA